MNLLKISNKHLLEVNIILIAILISLVVWDIAITMSSDREIIKEQNNTSYNLSIIAEQLSIDLY